jgi:four helix bundle protein
MNNFRELKVWHKSVDLVVEIYKITKAFPDTEKFNLISQMQRSGTSIPSNIAEGAGRISGAYFKQFLAIALGSAYELETQLIISKKLSYISEERYDAILKDVTEIQRMIFGLINTL